MTIYRYQMDCQFSLSLVSVHYLQLMRVVMYFMKRNVHYQDLHRVLLNLNYKLTPPHVRVGLLGTSHLLVNDVNYLLFMNLHWG